ncbi:hypothetical protein WJX74_000985 [Apatococcus lobatus]|uniref:RanBD1 domain-containing protein n=1 Tax=Apatococcus lobatus TaxID=904363 RepID=A0AAW1RZC2_9CHLO
MSKRPTDDLEPSAKRGKRGSDRQLTKDDPSDDEDGPPVLAGTFARASEEELKGRKIIKARRSGASGTPAANPFAGVSLTSSTGNPFAGVSLLGAKPGPTSTAQAESTPSPAPVADTPVVSSPAKQPPANDSAAPSSDTAAASPDPPDATSAQPTATPASTPVKPAAPAMQSFSTFANSTASAFAVTASSASGFAFGQASAPAASTLDPAGSSLAAGASSSAPQAGTSIFGSGSSAGSFSFGTIPAASTSSFPSMQSIFGTSSTTDAPHVFGAAGTSAKPAVELSEADTKNGEEDESTAFHGDGKLFQFVDNSWRERGSGDMRLNVGPSGQARLVMRQRGNLKLLLNANLFPGMTHDLMDGGKGAMFQAMNYAAAKNEPAGADKLPAEATSLELTTFAFKSKQPGIVSAFHASISKHKPPAKAPQGS